MELRADLDDMVSTCSYNTSLRELLDQHAPEKVNNVTVPPMVPWFAEQALQSKRQPQKSEINWKGHKSAECQKGAFSTKHTRTIWMLEKKYSINETKTNDNCGNDQKRLFNAVSNLIGNRTSNPLLESSSNTELANDVASLV